MGYFSRRRSFFIKLIVVVSTAWFTVAFLLYSDNRQPIEAINPVVEQQELPNANALRQQPEAFENKHLVSTIFYSNNSFLKIVHSVQAIENEIENQQDPKQIEENEIIEKDPEKKKQYENEEEEERAERDEEEHKKNEDQQGFLKMPGQGDYGEMGKPVILPKNMTAEMKKIVDEGWQKNAFNQYASDMISVRRSLPDPRDEW